MSTDTENGYMYLHMDEYSRVDEIIAISPHPLRETDNYLCLYNLHERYLNNMLRRYEEGLIPDLYVFFRQPWACAIFHDRFGDFMDEIKDQLGTVAVKVKRCVTLLGAQRQYARVNYTSSICI